MERGDPALSGDLPQMDRGPTVAATLAAGRGAGRWFETQIAGSTRAEGLELEEVLERWSAFLESLEARTGNLPAVYKNSLLTHLDYEQRRRLEARAREERPRTAPTPTAPPGETVAYAFSYAMISELLEREGQPRPTREEFRGMCAEAGFVDSD